MALQTKLPGLDQPWMEPTDVPRPEHVTKPSRPMWWGDGAVLLMAFHQALMENGQPVWFDSHRPPKRCVIRRAENRFQAFQVDEGDWLSQGYFLARNDIRAYLHGQDVNLYSDMPGDLDPVMYRAYPVQSDA